MAHLNGAASTAVTDATGTYRFVTLAPGHYELTAMLSGFAQVTRTGVQVAVGQTVTINMQMATAGLQESVTVTGEAPLVDVSTSSLGSNISQAQMEELPVNSTPPLVTSMPEKSGSTLGTSQATFLLATSIALMRPIVSPIRYIW